MTALTRIFSTGARWKFLSAIACCVLLLSSGCAAPASSMGMTVGDLSIAPNPSLAKKFVVLSVSGGSETNPMWASKVGNDDFKKALEASLLNLGYLAKAGQSEAVGITAELQELNQPLIALDADVDASVLYVLKMQGKDREIKVSSTGTATVGDAFYGVRRLQIANERAINENIKKFLEMLSKIQ